MHVTPDPDQQHPEPVTVTRQPTSPLVVFAAGAAVASLLAAGAAAADDDVAPGLHKPPAYVGGGIWGGG